MKEKKIFESTIVTRNENDANYVEDVLYNEGISFFKESRALGFAEFKCNLSWIDLKHLIKQKVLNPNKNEIKLRTYY